METKPDTSALVKPREIQSAKRPPTCLGLALSGRDRWRSRPTASSSSRGWCEWPKWRRIAARQHWLGLWCLWPHFC